MHVRITRAWDRGCAEAATRIDVKAVLGQGLDGDDILGGVFCGERKLGGFGGFGVCEFGDRQRGIASGVEVKL